MTFLDFSVQLEIASPREILTSSTGLSRYFLEEMASIGIQEVTTAGPF